MEDLKCKSCGAPLTPTVDGRYKCSYCGSLYERSNDHGVISFIEIRHPQIQTLSATVSVPFEARDFMDPKEISEMSLARLTEELAKGLASYFKVYTRNDPFTMATIIRGEVRVLSPDFRF